MNQRLRVFRTLSELCWSSASGLQIHCDAAGLLQRPAVLNPLWRNHNYWLVESCIRNCHCYDIAPSSPENSEHPRQSSNTYHAADALGSLSMTNPQLASNSFSGKLGAQCYNHNQCNVKDGYVCSQAAYFQVPTSNTWGRFQCNYIPHVSATALKASRCSSGRCLLESDGSVISNPPLDGNMITLDRTAPRAQFIDSTSGSTNGDLETSSGNESNVTKPSETEPVEATQSGVQSWQTKMGQKNVSDSGTFIPPSSTPLLCPCNCTYFAFGCCFTNVITEPFEPSYNSNTVWEPPFPGLTCDPYSGLWLAPKGTGQDRRKGG